MTKHKVLFMSAPFGAGHIRAAQAVMALLEQQPNIETRLVNIFDFVYPQFNKYILKMYIKILEIFPQAYGSMYGWGNSSKFALKVRQLINSFFATKLHYFIKEINPDIIVCTHATPAGLIAALVKQKKIKQTTIAIVTDFVVHRWWVYPELHYYFVANNQMKEYLMKFNIPAEAVQITGIPVYSHFIEPVNKHDIAAKYQLSLDHKTVLIMGGGAGVLPMADIFNVCNEMNFPMQIIVVTGHNKAVLKKLKSLDYKCNNQNVILGFVNNIHELMSISDLIISKPGGLTSSEALVKYLPMIIYRPIPGQEIGNTEYLVNKNIAIKVNDLKELKSVLNDLFINNPNLVSLKLQKILQILF